MSAQIILFACYGFIFWLFRKDIDWRKAGARSLLLPGVFLAIQGSRPLSYWFEAGGGSESSPIDTLPVFAFLVLSIVVLSKRGLDWGRLVAGNKALFVIYSYLLLSLLWSEMPISSLKRLVKDFEIVLLGLIFLTEVNPADAIRVVYVRVSYILFPLSAVFIKYFPEIGRQSTRAGDNMFTGITTQKNSLGETVFVFSLFILWDLFVIAREANRKGKKQQLVIRGGMLVLGLWLLITCDSQTSLVCLTLGTVIFWGGRRLVKMRRGKRLLFVILVSIVGLVAFDNLFGFTDMVIRSLGRDPNLTGRTDIWRLVLEQQESPLIGSGYYIFWDSDKGMAVKDAFMRINSAHNGFLEMYLDGGLVGGVLLCLLLLGAGWRSIDRLFDGHSLGQMGLVVWLLAILYNFSETSFFRQDVLWFTFVLFALEYRRPRAAGAPRPVPYASRALTAELFR